MPRWKPKLLPSAAELQTLFDYSEETGGLTWKRRSGNSRSDLGFNNKVGGKPAGTVHAGRDGNKYLVIGIGGSYFKAHRIIWKMVTGEEPPEFIDHEDGDNFNNRFGNFRDADNGKNLQNAKLRKDNKSGVKGVSWDAHHKKWAACIAINGKQTRLGRFDTIEAAAAVVNAARGKVHGKFARYR